MTIKQVWPLISAAKITVWIDGEQFTVGELPDVEAELEALSLWALEVDSIATQDGMLKIRLSH